MNNINNIKKQIPSTTPYIVVMTILVGSLAIGARNFSQRHRKILKVHEVAKNFEKNYNNENKFE